MTLLIITTSVVVLGIGAWFAGADPTIIAVIGTVFGGILLKFTEHWLGARKKVDPRPDLRAEVLELQQRLDKLEEDYEVMRNKYYAGQEQILTLKAMIIGAGINPDKTL